MNPNFPQTFRYAGGSYQVVARKPESTEVLVSAESRYKLPPPQLESAKGPTSTESRYELPPPELENVKSRVSTESRYELRPRPPPPPPPPVRIPVPLARPLPIDPCLDDGVARSYSDEKSSGERKVIRRQKELSYYKTITFAP